MHLLHLLSVWVHVIAAMTWVGGMLFLVMVVVPWLRQGKIADARGLLRDTGRRFRTVGWACFAALLVTGTFNLWMRGVRLESFADPAWRASSFGIAVELKLALFAVILMLSATHDFVLGPRATLTPTDPRQAERMRKQASWLGRLNLLVALAIVGVAVVLVRGGL